MQTCDSPGGLGGFWRWKAKGTDVEDTVLIPPFSQHEAVLREQAGVEVVSQLRSVLANCI